MRMPSVHMSGCRVTPSASNARRQESQRDQRQRARRPQHARRWAAARARPRICPTIQRAPERQRRLFHQARDRSSRHSRSSDGDGVDLHRVERRVHAPFPAQRRAALRAAIQMRLDALFVVETKARHTTAGSAPNCCAADPSCTSRHTKSPKPPASSASPGTGSSWPPLRWFPKLLRCAASRNP